MFAFCTSLFALALAPTVDPAFAQTHASNVKIAFDIPEQSLAGALDAYSVATGLELLYDSTVVSQRRSTAVKGEFTAADALLLLLDGTALSARTIAEDAVTIQARPQMEAKQAPLAPAPEKSAHQHYYGLIQAGLQRTFCSNDQLRPGQYRAVLSFMIGGNGHITASRVVGTTGDDARDQMIARALDRTELERPPPADLQQPIMMVILPQSSGMVLNCASIR